MKVKAVHFDREGYARVMVNPSPELLSIPNTLVNPDLRAVAHTPMEYWKLSAGKIVPMSDSERAIRDADLSVELDATWTSVVHLDKIIFKTPLWAYGVMAAETLALIAHLLIAH
jgi:hypothetical protein